jgi:hypothetical protein
MRWAEFLDGEKIGTGYLDYDASRRRWSHRFEDVQVPAIAEIPLPGSAFLLAPALILLIGYRFCRR